MKTLLKTEGFFVFHLFPTKATFVSLHKLLSMSNSVLILFLSILLFSCKNQNGDSKKQQPLKVNEMIAIAHGIEHWSKVEELRFSFNVERGESHFERSWIWKPKTKDITRILNEDSLRYNQNQMDSIALKADANFINDKFWLLAPFNLVWDEGTTFTQKDSVSAPISKKPMQQLTVVYGEEGGYTPGDAYDFFFENDFLIKEWIFRKGNEPTPGITSTWENYEDHHGLKIATMHQTSDGAFKLYFTNIEVITNDE